MKIIGVTACIAGIAHTYIAKEKFENAAREMGHEIKIETQGSIGVENELTDEDIKNADVVVIAADIKVATERFKGKPVVNIPISVVIKNPKSLIKKLEEKITK